MKLDEVIHSKRQAVAGFSKHELEAAVENIFKWKATIRSLHNGTWLLDVVVPSNTSEEDYEFTVGMMQRKLPSLVAKHLADGKVVKEPRPLYPQMKARPGQKIDLGVPPKVRFPIQ